MKNSDVMFLCILVFIVALVVGVLLGISIERATTLAYIVPKNNTLMPIP